MPIKILQITNKPAYPAIDGGCLEMAKMSNLYNSNKNYSLDILTVATSKHAFDKNEFSKKLSSNTNIFSVFINTKPSITGAIKYFFGNKSYNLSRFNTKEFEKKLISILKNNEYDFIQFQSIYVAQYFKTIKLNSKAKLVLNTPNVEFEIWERLALKASFLKKFYLKKLAKQLKKEEENIWKNMDGIISITDKDKFLIGKRIKKNIPIITIPFYLNSKEYNPSFNSITTSISFFHIGAMDWLPNIEGVKWFLDNIWNSQSVNQVNMLNLAGKSMPDSLRNIRINNLNVQGFVSCAKEFMSENDVMIVPLFSGSGIRIKIIEAMALGKCIISTKVGAEGINYTESENILIANSKDEFIAKMNFLSKNTEKIKEIGKKARLLIEKEHNIDLMEPKLKEFFTDVSI